MSGHWIACYAGWVLINVESRMVNRSCTFVIIYVVLVSERFLFRGHTASEGYFFNWLTFYAVSLVVIIHLSTSQTHYNDRFCFQNCLDFYANFENMKMKTPMFF